MLLLHGYEIKEQLYASQKIHIYRGLRQSDNLPVVIKTSASEEPPIGQIARLSRELAIARSAAGEGVIVMYDLASVHNRPALIMEDISAVSMRMILSQLHFEHFLRIATNLAGALTVIHAAQIIHKDIKPDNIIVNLGQNKVRIIDFGIASRLSREKSFMPSPESLEGTLHYIAPEQTGRVNRSFDHRSDLYSLGATFYEMLTGSPPFQGDDPMELIHCHIAQRPTPPRVAVPERKIPASVSEIVMKLLEKNAEDRYQSAFGLKVDLERCLGEYNSAGHVRRFTPGLNDVSERFEIPQKLYGREEDINVLERTFEQLDEEHFKAIFISGPPGIGKTALVNELQKSITLKRGFFIEGKYDQFNRSLPYRGISQAFRSLLTRILTGDPEQLAGFKHRLGKALGKNAGVLISILPELGYILDHPPAAVHLEGPEEVARFSLLFRKFIMVFAKASHPLILFLDDLQWAESASLKLLEFMMLDVSPGALLLIGSFRDQELAPGHLLPEIREKLQVAGLEAQELNLGPINQDSLDQLLADSLHREISQIQELSEIVREKTGGSPFFVSEFLKTLYTKKLLNFDSAAGHWNWNIQSIRDMDITGNVVELMGTKIQELPPATEKLMLWASCLGGSFDLRNLCLAADQKPVAAMEILEVALREGLLIPLNDDYKYVENDWDVLRANGTLIPFRFPHDRVRQAAYSLIEDQEKPAFHLKTGQLLLKAFQGEELEEKLIVIVGHLNQGRRLLKKHSEKVRLMELNLQAGLLAKKSAAPETAEDLFQLGIEILGPEIWSGELELAFQLHIELLEVLFLQSKFEDLDDIAKLILSKNPGILTSARVYEIWLSTRTVQGRYDESIAMSRDILAQLKTPIPARPSVLSLLFSILRTEIQLRFKPLAEIENIPDMTAPHIIAAMSVLMKTTSAAYLVSLNLSVYITMLMVRLSLKYGHCSQTPYGFAGYGLLLTSVLKQIPRGFAYGKLALRQAERLKDNGIRGKITLLFNCFIRPWNEPLPICIAGLREGMEIAEEEGDLEFVAYNMTVRITDRFWQGEKLSRILAQKPNYLKRSTLHKHDFYRFGARAVFQTAENLLSADAPSFLDGPLYQNEQFKEELEATGNGTGMGFQFFLSMFLQFMHGNGAAAAKLVPRVNKFLDANTGSLVQFLMVYYMALVQCEIYNSCSPFKKFRIRLSLRSALSKIRFWSRFNPREFMPYLKLLDAEILRIKNKGPEKSFEDAYKRSRASKNLILEALSAERLGLFYESKGLKETAAFWMRKAVYAYRIWGAGVKTSALEKKYPELKVAESLVKSNGAPIPNITSQVHTPAPHITTSELSGNLDLLSVVKASHTLSGEIVLEKLLDRMIRLLLESGGAEKGFLVLESAGNLLLEAEARLNPDFSQAMQSKVLDDSSAPPASILEYVRRTGETLVLDDAAETGDFTQNEYIRNARPRSLLCTPILHQGKLTALLFLENNLSSGAFTSERLEVLSLLSSQVAISIENARLYGNLESKVQERTSALQSSLDEVQKLKNKQDGDYFLTSQLIIPLTRNSVDSERIEADFLLKQFKQFTFQQWNAELGGDICIAHSLPLEGIPHVVFLNADAMGKSMQGAGGALVLGAVFEAAIERARQENVGSGPLAEVWLRNLVHELQNVFESFNGNMLVTIVVGVINEASGNLLLVNGEHPWTVLYRNKKASYLEKSVSLHKIGAPMQNRNFEINSYQLVPGDIILTGSDGRDDILLKGKNEAKTRLNTDAAFFLQRVEEGQGELQKIYQSITNQGNLTDDLSLLRLKYD